MHDIRSIRENPAAFDKGLRNRGMEPLSGRLIALDDGRKAAVSALQAAMERRNALSKEIGQAKAKKDEARAQELMAEVARLKEAMPELEEAERAADRALFDALAAVPNIPKDDVPVGADEHGNVERHRLGHPRTLNSSRQHFEIGEALGLMDFETAAKLSGSRFVVLKGGLAHLERALGQFMIDLHTNEHGYTEVSPPLLVRDRAMFGTAQLPKFEDDQFVALDGLTMRQITRVLADAVEGAHEAPDLIRANAKSVLEWIPKGDIGSSPPPRCRSPIWCGADPVEEELPLRFTALTPSFRAEAGSPGATPAA
jgi:seryl-tRNA synthetase